MFQIEDVNKQIARKLKVDIKLVTEVNRIQWKELLHSLNNIKESEIKMVYLGTFTPRYTVVKKRIRHLINAIRSEQKKIENPGVKNNIIKLKEQLTAVWKIKNEFAIKNIKAKLKKQNRQNE